MMMRHACAGFEFHGLATSTFRCRAHLSLAPKEEDGGGHSCLDVAIHFIGTVYGIVDG